MFQEHNDFIAYLEELLIPDLRESGATAMPDDLEKFIRMYREAASSGIVRLELTGDGVFYRTRKHFWGKLRYTSLCHTYVKEYFPDVNDFKITLLLSREPVEGFHAVQINDEERVAAFGKAFSISFDIYNTINEFGVVYFNII